MDLSFTNQLMQDLQADHRVESWGVLVGIGNERTFISSADVNGDTYYDIASMGKVLVTTPLILHAVSEGKLSLTDTLPRFFDHVPENMQEINLLQMLTHTSGIVRFEYPPEAAEWSREENARQIIANPLAYEPGTRMRYSCNAMILLGFIAEKVYECTLDQAYEKYIKKPLGLTRSRFNIDVHEENAALCYRRKEVGAYRVDDPNVYLMKGVAGSGASFWTMSDIERYVDAVLRMDESLYARPLYRMAEADYNPWLELGQGLGWLIADERYPQTGKLFPRGSFGHCGHTGTSMFIHRQSGLFVVILTNATRCANIRSGFNGYDYGEVCAMRAKIHNEIRKDLVQQHLWEA